MKITRKQFLQASLATLAAGTGLGAVACGSDDDSSDGGSGGSSGSGSGGSGGTGASGGSGGSSGSGGSGGSSGAGGSGGTAGGGGASCSADYDFNHGHSFEVTQADIDAMTDKTYMIQGTGTHDHTITLTAADFASLAGGSPVVVTTSNNNGHEHNITITC